MAKKILVVDDDPQTVRLLASRLRANNYEVIAASDCYQCVKMSMEERPDLILLDVKMPAGGGLSAFETLRRSMYTVTIPVIFITGYPDENIKKKVFEMGAEDFILKPFDSNDLLKKVRKALGEESESIHQ